MEISENWNWDYYETDIVLLLDLFSLIITTENPGHFKLIILKCLNPKVWLKSVVTFMPLPSVCAQDVATTLQKF